MLPLAAVRTMCRAPGDAGRRAHRPIAAAGPPVHLTVSRTDLTITRTGATTFDYAAHVSVLSPTAVPINFVGHSCSASVDTSKGNASTLLVSGAATFSSQSGGGRLDRVDVTSSVTGYEAQDLTVTGTGCTAGNLGVVILSDLVNGAIGGGVHLCGAPGSALFIACPARP